MRIDKHNEYLVISTWKDIAAWNAWKENQQRKELQRQIDVMLNEPTQYEVYSHL
jgi:heme-degrading monooxygenase HmoA